MKQIHASCNKYPAPNFVPLPPPPAPLFPQAAFFPGSPLATVFPFFY